MGFRGIALGIGLVLACGGCSDGSKSGRGGGDIPRIPFNPTVLGGQTGALMPACGLSPAAAAGQDVPGGDSGIVMHVDACPLGFDLDSLALRDEAGRAIPFDRVPLDGSAVLLRPREPLSPGVYTIDGAGDFESTVTVAEEPPELPMRLGSLRRVEEGCNAAFELDLDPLLLDYLPQLRLSVSIDGAPATVWFDYGTLEVEAGGAVLSLPQCHSTCLSESGYYIIEVTGELAGELGTLEPVAQSFEVRCPAATAAPDDGGIEEASAFGCRVAPRSGGTGVWIVLAWALAARWRRRSRAPT